jgi:hypothetical protein
VHGTPRDLVAAPAQLGMDLANPVNTAILGMDFSAWTCRIISSRV